MKARHLKRRALAMHLHRLRRFAALQYEMGYWYELDYDGDDPWRDDAEPCENCGGDGRDPMADYLLPCPLCLGDA